MICTKLCLNANSLSEKDSNAVYSPKSPFDTSIKLCSRNVSNLPISLYIILSPCFCNSILSPLILTLATKALLLAIKQVLYISFLPPIALKDISGLYPFIVLYVSKLGFVDIRFISTPPDSYGGVHGDNLQKVWTIIIYAWPEKSSGTVLWTNVSLDESPHCYDEKPSGLTVHNGDIIESVMHSEVDWKVNRAIFFSPGEKKDGWTETPHQIINASKDTGRLILMFNVFKSKLGGVHSKEECKPFSKQNFDDYCG